MKEKILKFAMYDEVFSPIVTMKSLVPEWYKSIEKFKNGAKQFSLNPPNVTVKVCGPYMDSMLTGYALTTPVDFLVEIEEGKPKIKHRLDGHFFGERSPDQEVPAPPGFYSQQFAWETKAAIGIPDGYSFLFTHPLNRVDLPFYTLSGVVDGPYDMQPGNFPFYIRKGFSGIIEAGTPIAQIIPIKQEAWKSVTDPGIIERAEKNHKLSNKAMLGWYKKTIWKRKSYE
jgi:hypothetical protein